MSRGPSSRASGLELGIALTFESSLVPLFFAGFLGTTTRSWLREFWMLGVSSVLGANAKRKRGQKFSAPLSATHYLFHLDRERVLIHTPVVVPRLYRDGMRSLLDREIRIQAARVDKV